MLSIHHNRSQNDMLCFDLKCITTDIIPIQLYQTIWHDLDRIASLLPPHFFVEAIWAIKRQRRAKKVFENL
jgi:hypothetical protein